MFRNRSCLSKQSFPIIVLFALALLFAPYAHLGIVGVKDAAAAGTKALLNRDPEKNRYGETNGIYPPYPYEIIEKGNAREALQEYEAEAIKLESEGKLEKAAICYRDASWLARQAGNYQKGILYGTKAIKLSEKGNQPRFQAQALFQTAKSYVRIADYEKAMQLLENAVTLASRLGNMHGLKAMCNEEIGYIYGKLLSPEKALEHLKKAYDFYATVITILEEPIPTVIHTRKRIHAGEPGNIRNLTDILIAMGDSYAELSDYKAASEFLDKALYYASGTKEMTLKTYLSMGDLNYKKGDYQKALEYHEKACQLADIVNIPLYTVPAYSKAARDYEVIKKPEEAVKHYRKAIDSIEDQRSVLQSEDMRSSFFQQMYTYYEDATVFMLENNYSDKAFQCAESMKARVFLDQLAEGLVDLEKGVDPDLRKKRDELEARISALNIQRLEEVEEEKSDALKIESFKHEIDKYEKELEDVKTQIRLKNPEYANVQYPQPIGVDKLQREILGKDESVLEYFVSYKGVYCLVVTKDRYETVKLSVKAEDLSKDVEAFLKPIRETVVLGQLQRFDINAAVRLYEGLIKPVEPYVQDKTLIIVPDGPLAYLPFESLLEKTGDNREYLLEKYRIKYVQSATVLEILRTRYKKEGLSDTFIGFGDPVYDYESYKAGKPEKGSEIKGLEGGAMSMMAQLTWSGYARAGGKLDRLVGSGEEVKAIEGIFKEKKVGAKGYLRLDAREENAKSGDMAQYGYIHFSTHGILEPGFQAIALSQIPDSQEDGMLTLGEIMNCRYNAGLVVLSACETGLGKMERGEGVTGLTRAVMYAGTSAVVVSLWSVSDEGTKELMVKFYEKMIKEKGMTKAGALREAKKEMLKNDTFHNPYFWSAFVMYGE